MPEKKGGNHRVLPLNNPKKPNENYRYESFDRGAELNSEFSVSKEKAFSVNVGTLTSSFSIPRQEQQANVVIFLDMQMFTWCQKYTDATDGLMVTDPGGWYADLL